MHSNGEEPRSKKKKGHSGKNAANTRWIISAFIITVLISSAFSFLSSEAMAGAGLVEAFVVLLVIVLIGILFDVIGIAVTAASEKPFHSMAAKKVTGAAEALALLRNADKVSSICNDVVGDVCGVISGSASAAIAVRALSAGGSNAVAQLLMSAFVAGLTVAGKASCKHFAMRQSTGILHVVSKCIYYIKSLFRRKKKQ
ncbi:MAG: hypothetical protein LBM28_04990 [Oscillospiraceae bacterium]|nr:hypothetical protein [Oscillospiraceae bacterium]